MGGSFFRTKPHDTEKSKRDFLNQTFTLKTCLFHLFTLVSIEKRGQPMQNFREKLFECQKIQRGPFDVVEICKLEKKKHCRPVRGSNSGSPASIADHCNTSVVNLYTKLFVNLKFLTWHRKKKETGTSHFVSVLFPQMYEIMF